MKQELQTNSMTERESQLADEEFVSSVAAARATSYESAFAEMQDLKIRYGIQFQEFVRGEFHRCEDDEDLARMLSDYAAREAQCIRRVSSESGWSLKDAEARMREVKRRFPTVDLQKFANHMYFTKSDDQIAADVRWVREAVEANCARAAQAAGWSRSKVRQHMANVQTLYGIGPAYYMCYRAWELSDAQLATYLVQRHSDELVRRFNNPIAAAVLERKDEFHRAFREVTQRKFWLNRDTDFDEFLSFAERVEAIFCKPLQSRHGLGTFGATLPKSVAGLRELYVGLTAQPRLVVEESISQHPEISEFYPKSVNTIRVITIRDESGVHVLAAPMRFGLGGITDNFSRDGVVCDVDLVTGQIVTPAIDRVGNVYARHPFSNTLFEGFQVPRWGEAIEVATRAMELVPEVNYVGWDVAVTRRGVCLVEGNAQSGLGLVQAPYARLQQGRKHLVDRFLNG